MSIASLAYAPEINMFVGSVESASSIVGTSSVVNAPPITLDNLTTESALTLNTHAQQYVLSSANYGSHDGQLSLNSTNANGTTNVFTVYPQTDTLAQSLLVNCNETIGATGNAQIFMDAFPTESVIQSKVGNSTPDATSLCFGTGGVNSVMITDNKLYVTSGSTVGRVYDDTIYPPPSGGGGGGGGDQTLDLSGSTLSISNGNSVSITGDNVQPRVYPIQTVTYVTGLSTPFTISASGVYLFVFTCQMTCSGAGVPAGANINFSVGPAVGGVTAMAFAPVSQANSGTQLFTQACGIGNVATAGNYQFVGAPANTGMGSPVYTAYEATVTLYLLI